MNTAIHIIIKYTFNIVQIQQIGNQLVTLLCETKHRGAFEQCHVGFSQLFCRLWHLDELYISLKQLPKMWLQQLLLAVIGLTPENSKLCATRRSAGVPFMVQVIVKFRSTFLNYILLYFNYILCIS